MGREVTCYLLNRVFIFMSWNKIRIKNKLRQSLELEASYKKFDDNWSLNKVK